MANTHEERALALIGTRFRPQGRSTEGIDCVGVIVATFRIDRRLVRSDYAMRGGSRTELEESLQRFFRRVPQSQACPGDVLLVQAAREQLHLAIKTRGGFVHAHAGLRRVVETPGEPEWPLLGAYRFRTPRRS